MNYMSLVSLEFFFFCVLVITVYFIVPIKFKWIVLLLSSVFFLFYKNLNLYTVLQAFIVLVTGYLFAIMIYQNSSSKKSKKFLILGIIIILFQLFYLKYSNLILITLNHIFNLLSINIELELVHRNSLIGISYYSLIMIGYLIDVYRNVCMPQRNIFKCALFMTYFPILTSGPFIRYNKSNKELYEGYKFNYDRLCMGLIRVLFGLFKVLVISKRIGFYVDSIYGNLANYSGLFVVIAVLLFPMQLYTNFSGSIDIIMGVSEIIGINLPENFTTPFFSKTITEFWRNWHITLGSWLRDYVFYPIAKSGLMQKFRVNVTKRFGKWCGKKIPIYLSMLIMWLLIGIWHGGEYTYIVSSGILQFCFMVLEDILEPVFIKINKKLGIKSDVFSYKLYQCLRTYCLFSFAMIFFRASSIKNAFEIIRNMFVWNPWILFDGSLYNAGLDSPDFKVLFMSLFILLIVEKIELNGSVRQKLFNQNIFFRWTIIYSLIFLIIIFGCYGVGYDATQFIYGKF